MKKTIRIFIAFVMALALSLSLVACRNNGTSVDTSKDPSDNAGADVGSNDYNGENQVGNDNQQQSYNISVSVTNKTNIPEDINNGRYSDRVEFSFSIKNNESKNIKGIKGILKVKDLFGSSILSLGCDFTGKNIASNSTTTFSGIGIDINQFMDNHVKLYNENYSDLNFEYEIEQIVYSSEKAVAKTTYDEVDITVTNKTNLEEDIYNGRYSPRVEFDFSIYNKSTKSIKGIQGVLVVKDLFDDEIIRINCDFTGATIASKSSATYEDLGIDINQFMDNHVSLYNENYSDLNFEYEVSTIVYTDGTTVTK